MNKVYYFGMFYVPYFEKGVEAYYFWLVHPSVLQGEYFFHIKLTKQYLKKLVTSIKKSTCSVLGIKFMSPYFEER